MHSIVMLIKHTHGLNTQSLVHVIELILRHDYKNKTPSFPFISLTEYFCTKFVESISRKITLLHHFLNESQKQFGSREMSLW